MARPTLPSDKVRSVVVVVRLTEAERQALHTRARELGLKASQLLRRLILALRP